MKLLCFLISVILLSSLNIEGATFEAKQELIKNGLYGKGAKIAIIGQPINVFNENIKTSSIRYMGSFCKAGSIDMTSETNIETTGETTEIALTIANNGKTEKLQGYAPQASIDVFGATNLTETHDCFSKEEIDKMALVRILNTINHNGGYDMLLITKPIEKIDEQLKKSFEKNNIPIISVPSQGISDYSIVVASPFEKMPENSKKAFTIPLKEKEFRIVDSSPKLSNRKHVTSATVFTGFVTSLWSPERSIQKIIGSILSYKGFHEKYNDENAFGKPNTEKIIKNIDFINKYDSEIIYGDYNRTKQIKIKSNFFSKSKYTLFFLGFLFSLLFLSLIKLIIKIIAYKKKWGKLGIENLNFIDFFK